MRRREFLAVGAAASASLLLPGTVRAEVTRDVEWLSTVNRPPEALPVSERSLVPLLVNEAGQPIETRKAWAAERQRLHDAWLKFLGPMPTERPGVKLEVLNRSVVQFPKGGACHRDLVRYQAEADEFVEGYLLQPVGEQFQGLRPGIVALHQTSRESIDEIANVEAARPGNQDLAFQLCAAGFVVFCPRCFLWQTPPEYNIDVKTTVERFHKRHPDTVGMHKMLFDAQRAVDILVSLPSVDPKRIGTVGHSLGGKEVLYLMAFDERVKAGVASEGGLAFSSTNWADPWYLGSRIKAPDFKLNHHQILALAAPRPLLILGGESGPGAADGNRSWPYLAAAQPVYGLDQQPVRLGMLNHQQGHSIPNDVYQKLQEWLQVYTAQA